MKTFIYPEMLVHIPMCTHKDPQSVLVLSDTPDGIAGELGRYRGVEIQIKGEGALLETLRNVADKSSDVVLLDALSDDAAVMAHINRLLKDEGLFVLRHPSLDEEAANKQLMQVLGNYFKIIMPYTVGDGSTLLLCSKEYHPTADVILQRTDLLEGHRYYNCDIHIAAFAMPQYIRKSYLGIIRN